MLNPFIVKRQASEKRLRNTSDGCEWYLSEAAIMLAFATHLLNIEGATAVSIHPDGEHAKCFPIRAWLEANGFQLIEARGGTDTGGVYSDGLRTITVAFTPGKGDVAAVVNGRVITAECKGGVTNSTYAGQTSRLRRGLNETIGQLMSRPLNGERQIAVVPHTSVTAKLAAILNPRARVAGIELALVSSDGAVSFVV